MGAACPGCGIRLDHQGRGAPPHAGASAGCWAAYGDLLAREVAEWSSPAIHRLTVHVYAAQHPGEESRAAAQALGGHLVALHLAVERGVEPERLARELGRAIVDPSALHWLEPPGPRGRVTILDVRQATSLREHTTRVQRWARSVWESWSDHHETIRGWAGL